MPGLRGTKADHFWIFWRHPSMVHLNAMGLPMLKKSLMKNWIIIIFLPQSCSDFAATTFQTWQIIWKSFDAGATISGPFLKQLLWFTLTLWEFYGTLKSPTIRTTQMLADF
jgi:hypothetical protein